MIQKSQTCRWKAECWLLESLLGTVLQSPKVERVGEMVNSAGCVTVRMVNGGKCVCGSVGNVLA